jgi:beta-glucanase (GH16 family)
MSFRQALSHILPRRSQSSSGRDDPPVSTSSKLPPTPATRKQSPKRPSPYWQPTFSASTPISEHFTHEVGAHGWGNNELQNYVAHPCNSFHAPSGKLILRAIADSTSAGDNYTSARLSSRQTLSRCRGCLTVVLTAPCAPGIWPACWLLPAEPFAWPREGEVDVFESWNGDRVNHSCLHWGYHTRADWDKHRVRDTQIADMAAPAGHAYAFAWDQPARGEGGRMVWYIDGRAVMKAQRPPGTRSMEDWRVIFNVAMGGNVCAGRVPQDGCYDFEVHELRMCDEPDSGWEGFERDWVDAKEGHANAKC